MHCFKFYKGYPLVFIVLLNDGALKENAPQLAEHFLKTKKAL